MTIEADKIGQGISDNHGTINQTIHNAPADNSSLPGTIPSITGFVGREEYLKDLSEAYKNGTRYFVLHGIGGVGKTALALQFANEIAGDFAAKILVDMQGMSEKPYSWRDAMFEIVRQFEPKIPVEIPDAQLKGFFVQFVQSQKTLIVLDNAANKQSVEMLKQANACFITTSRESFVLTGGKSLAIQKMLPEDARKLLFEIVKDENRFEGRANELAWLAGCLPMALKPLASILAEDELETVADLIKRYTDKKNLLEERVPDYDDLTIEASFELSYEKLSPELQQHWRRLSVFPSDFDEFAIASILDVSDKEAHETQKHLRRYSLLEVNPETKRFNLHDLARAFTNEKLSEDEYFQTQFLFARYYVSILAYTDEMQRNRAENYYTNALKLLDTEWDNITAGQKWTAEFIEQYDHIAELCTDYSGYAREFMTLRLHQRINIEWLKFGLKAARKLKSRQREGSILGSLGIAYKNLGEYRKAIEYHKQYLQISRERGDRLNESIGLGNLGLAYYSLGEYQKAIEYHGQALQISRELDSKLGKSQDLSNLGIAYASLGKYRKAIEYTEQALEISRELGNRQGEGLCLGNLGLAYASLGEPRKAIEYYEQSLNISREIGDRQGEGNSLGNLGAAYISLGEKEKACGLWKEALAIFEAIESPVANVVRGGIEEDCGN